MYQICITIDGHRHCFPVPSLIDQSVIHRPLPNNMPILELAVSVLALVDVVPASELSRQLADAAKSYIKELQKELPNGVELSAAKAHQAAG